MLIKLIASCVSVFLFAITSLAVSAQEVYPAKPIKLIIPFGAGGITDVVGRLIGQQLGEELKQTVIIENKPGAGGAIAAQSVAQSQNDGYTLLLGTVGTQVVNKMLNPKLQYDPTSLAPVSLVSNSPYVLAIGNIPGVTNLQGLISYANKNPGKLDFGSAGNGSSPHLGIELFKLSTGTFITHIPFKSGAEAVTNAIGGQVQIVIDAIPVILPQSKAGNLKILAIASSRRNPAIPDVPTSSEAGVPEFQIGSWNAIVAPGGTPPARIQILNDSLARVLAKPAVLNKLAEMGVDPMPVGLSAYQAHVRAETDRWSKVIKAAGTKID